MVGSRPSSELYSIPADAKGSAYLIKADGTITSSDDTSVATVGGGIDEGAFSISPDGQHATIARPRTDGQRDLLLLGRTSDRKVIATAAFVAIDGWNAASTALVVRTGEHPGSSWRTPVSWYSLANGTSKPVAQPSSGFAAGVIPSPVDVNTYLVGVVVTGTRTASLTAWWVTRDGGQTFGHLAPGALGSAAWSADGKRVAYTTLDESLVGTGAVALHLATLP
jgi:hypothetical protein